MQWRHYITLARSVTKVDRKSSECCRMTVRTCKAQRDQMFSALPRKRTVVFGGTLLIGGLAANDRKRVVRGERAGGRCSAASNRLIPAPAALETTSPQYAAGVDGRPLRARVPRMVRVGRGAVLADRCARGIIPVEPIVAVGAQAAERTELERVRSPLCGSTWSATVAGVTRPASKQSRHSGSIMS